MNRKHLLFGLVIILCSFSKYASHSFHSADFNIENIKPFTIGEKLVYKIAYGIIEAGNANLEVKSIASSPECFRVVAKGYTNFAFDWIFKVRDHYESIIDSSSMKPKFFIRNVSEGNVKFNQFYTFNHNKRIVNTGEQNIKVPDNVQDMVSCYFYARTLNLKNLKKDTVLSFNSIVDGEIYNLKVKYIGKEHIKIEAGQFNALKFCPIVQKGRIFKEEEDLTVWISDDYNKIPLLVKAKIWVGSVRMELEKMDGELNTPNLLE
ncbi:MAG: DUF3108 domain-containing protein [Bacteroidota bacterium]|nr:DUF3108 domain-containing protein [Bacteroidota bacterium]